MSNRDNQKSRLYDAEDALDLNVSKAALKYLTNGKKVESTGNVSIEACQAFVDHVTSSAWFQTRWGRRHFTVKHKVYGNATGGNGNITLPPWGRTEKIILHEMAHTLVGQSGGWHGERFAATLLTLVRYSMGAEQAKVLRAAYSKYRVKYRGGMSSVPKPGSGSVTPRSEISKKQAAAKRAAKVREQEAAKRRLSNISERKSAVSLIKTAVEAGWYGPPGSATRRAALATARTMEFPGKSKTVQAVRQAEQEAEWEARQQRVAARRQGE